VTDEKESAEERVVCVKYVSATCKSSVHVSTVMSFISSVDVKRNQN